MSDYDNTICLRQGYHCSCSQCQIWIARWDKELEAFSVVDKLIRDGKNLFQIYERLRAEYPDILRLHHVSIEDQYINFRKKNEPLPPLKKRKSIPSPLFSLDDSDSETNEKK